MSDAVPIPPKEWKPVPIIDAELAMERLQAEILHCRCYAGVQIGLWPCGSCETNARLISLANEALDSRYDFERLRFKVEEANRALKDSVAAIDESSKALDEALTRCDWLLVENDHLHEHNGELEMEVARLTWAMDDARKLPQWATDFFRWIDGQKDPESWCGLRGKIESHFSAPCPHCHSAPNCFPTNEEPLHRYGCARASCPGSARLFDTLEEWNQYATPKE